MRITAELETRGDNNNPSAEQTPESVGITPTNTPQEKQRFKSQTVISVELTPLPSREAKMPSDVRKLEEEVKEGKEELCEVTKAQVEKEDELEKEATHSTETDGTQN